MFKRIAVFAPMQAEADGFLPALLGQTQKLHGFTVRQIHYKGLEVAITVTGIGKVNMALAASILASHFQPDLLMAIGVAGALKPLPAHVAYQITSCIMGDYGERTAKGLQVCSPGLLPLNNAPLTPYTSSVFPNAGLPQARIISTDSFIGDAVFAHSLAEQFSGDLVDMEMAALAQVAEHFNLPWAGIKAITDSADDPEGKDFWANLNAASIRSAQAAADMILG